MGKNKISLEVPGDKISLFGFHYFADLMPVVDIVLPVYKPLDDWVETVMERYGSLCQARPEITWNLILINDGTPGLENTAAWSGLRTSLPRSQWHSYSTNRGKGFALRYGVKQSKGDFILYTDIDWPYTETSVLAVLDKLLSGSDAVIGIRDVRYYQQLPPWRRWISKMLRQINAIALRLKVNDTQAGLKGFRQKVAPVFLSTTIDRYLFDLEFVYLLSREKNLNITAVPIELRTGVTFSTMNRKVLLQEAGNFLKIMLRGKH